VNERSKSYIGIIMNNDKLNRPFILTSTNNIEGERITKYLGIVSGEISIGTGFLSEFKAGVADFFGAYAGAYSNKLGEAKAVAVNVMKKKAEEMGATAVVGIDIDIMTTDANIFIVCANGTAVITELDISDNANNRWTEIKSFDVDMYNVTRDININTIRFYEDKKGTKAVKLELETVKGILKALYANLIIKTVFDEIIIFKKVLFTDFENLKYKKYQSSESIVDIDADSFRIIKSVELDICKYIVDERIVEVDNHDMIHRDAHLSNTEFVSYEEIEENVEEAKSSSEIVTIIKNLYEERNLVIEEDLSKAIEDGLRVQRIYGGGKETLLDYIKKCFHNRENQ